MSRPPSNFSWVSKSVAGFAFPREKYELGYLVDNAGITHIITLCHEVPQYISDFTCKLIILCDILLVIYNKYTITSF
ncbi:unnamed protein product [Schistosoma rodhaini]|nr:unnamed protein product [Schistosoma rodhaini]